MSDETKEAEFGGWRKRKNLWKPKKKDRPYTVRRENSADEQLCYVARLTGDNPETLDAVVVGDDSEESALETAQFVCENHWRGQQPQAAKLGVATALVWTYDDETETWTAPGPDGRTYICEQGNKDDDWGWWAHLDDEELSLPVALEAAKAVCQQHRNTELVWRESAPGELWVATSAVLYSSEDYSCAPDGDDGAWQAYHLEQPIGDPGGFMQAQQECQDHHRKLCATQREAEGEMVQQPKPPRGKPPRELVTRSILCQLTEEELEAVNHRQALAQHEANLAEAALALAADKYKTRKKELEEILGAKRTSAKELLDLYFAGEEYRELQVHEQLGPEKGDGSPRDVIFTDPETGDERDRRPATKSELQKWLPAVPEKAQTEQDAALERIESMVDMDAETPPEEQVQAAAAEAADQLTAAEPGKVLVHFPRGSMTSSCEQYALRKERGLWVPCHGPGVLVSGDLPGGGEHTTKGAAIEQCQQHLDSRLVWTPVPGDDTQLFAGDGAYQVRPATSVDSTDGSAGWVALHGEGQLGGIHSDQVEAQAACQAHHDERRAGQ